MKNNINQKNMNNYKTIFCNKLFNITSYLKALSKEKIARVDKDFKGIVLLKFKSIYVPIPKVACSSIKQVFLEGLKIQAPLLPKELSDDLYDVHKAKFTYVRGNNIVKYKNYWKFGFVRNPWDRLLSCYKEKIKKDENYTEQNGWFINGVHKDLLKYGTFKANMSFEEFVNAVASIPDTEADPHFKSQYTFITDKRGKILLDFVGRFENLNEHFNYICKKIEIEKVALPYRNKTVKTNYQDFYNKSLREIVEKRYSKDIKIFKYNF
jgi:chondroitin 4-sulfotransferase 11